MTLYIKDRKHEEKPAANSSLAKSPILCLFERFNSSNSIEFCAKNSAIIKIKINSENL